MYLNEENINKIDAVHKKESKIFNIITDVMIPLSFFSVGYLTSNLVHSKLWNKADIKATPEAEAETETNGESAE